MFVGAHVLLAERTGVSELAITPEEGTEFLTRAQAVMRHYNVQTTQKAMDWIAFAGVASMIYVPRVVAISQNRKSKPSASVHHMPPQTSAPSTPSPQNTPRTMSPMEAAFNANMVIPEAAE